MSRKNRKPIALHLLEGNKNGLTKEEIKERQEHEERMKVNNDKIEPPSRLSAKQKENFNFYVEQLKNIDLISNLDVNILAQYIEVYDNYVRVEKSADRITNKEIDENFDEFAKRMRVMKQLTETCRQLAGDLGLTITSRLKLVIPQKEEKQESPMASFLKKRDNSG